MILILTLWKWKCKNKEDLGLHLGNAMLYFLYSSRVIITAKSSTKTNDVGFVYNT